MRDVPKATAYGKKLAQFGSTWGQQIDQYRAGQGAEPGGRQGVAAPPPGQIPGVPSPGGPLGGWGGLTGEGRTKAQDKWLRDRYGANYLQEREARKAQKKAGIEPKTQQDIINERWQRAPGVAETAGGEMAPGFDIGREGWAAWQARQQGNVYSMRWGTEGLEYVPMNIPRVGAFQKAGLRTMSTKEQRGFWAEEYDRILRQNPDVAAMVPGYKSPSQQYGEMRAAKVAKAEEQRTRTMAKEKIRLAEQAARTPAFPGATTDVNRQRALQATFRGSTEEQQGLFMQLRDVGRSLSLPGAATADIEAYNTLRTSLTGRMQRFMPKIAKPRSGMYQQQYTGRDRGPFNPYLTSPPSEWVTR